MSCFKDDRATLNEQAENFENGLRGSGLDAVLQNAFQQGMNLDEDVFLYLINYYGQLEKNYVEELFAGHKRIIVDNAQDFFCKPIDGVDTIYTCRKFFGVPDGARGRICQ